MHPPAETEASNWRYRLSNLLEYPGNSSVQVFQRDIVLKAMHSFAEEVNQHGVQTKVSDALGEHGVLRLEVFHGGETDFIYEVKSRSHPMPDQSLANKPMDDMQVGELFFRAEVHLLEGGQDYDIMGWTQEQVVVDILNQYENHLHFLHTVR